MMARIRQDGSIFTWAFRVCWLSLADQFDFAYLPCLWMFFAIFFSPLFRVDTGFSSWSPLSRPTTSGYPQRPGSSCRGSYISRVAYPVRSTWTCPRKLR